MDDVAQKKLEGRRQRERLAVGLSQHADPRQARDSHDALLHILAELRVLQGQLEEIHRGVK